MATTLSDTRPSFSRLIEGRKTQSWRSALPAVVVIVAFVALVIFLASRLSSASQKAAVAERDASQYRDQVTAMGKQVGDLQREVSLDRSPGRTTVILQAAEPKGKKGVAVPASKSWAAVIWGELPNGMSWMRVNAYGLSENLDGGKTWHVWMQPQTGDPIDVGTLQVDANGDGFAMKSDLPGIDQGKAVMLTTDPANSKQPGEPIAKADLPKLQPTMTAGPKGQPDQARTGSDTKQMHQEGK
ncbi:MAG: anti-sigma factor domain-containing protein [Myxococcales bacterium]